jgi:hypothetical protein
MGLETWATVAIGIMALIVQTIALIVGGIWALSRTEQNIRQQIADHKLENEERVNATMRSIGETFTGIRQKISEVDIALGKRITEIELYVRDTFLQKESFRVVIAEITANIKGLGDRIESRMQRMEDKFDKAQDRHDRNSSD